MTTLEQVLVKEKKMSPAKWLRALGWRHLVAIFSISFALFPLVWMASASFDQLGLVTAQKLIPDNIGLDNYRKIFNNPESPYFIWYRNAVVISLANALLQMAIGAFASYALSRFRFKGRKTTLLTILVVQMFPQLLSVTALFVLLAEINKSIPTLSFGSPLALIIIFAGGALGVNAWILKGFFDTIPMEIDESAKVDGASHVQIFFKIILPLALPALAVIVLLSFIGTMNEFVLTSVIMGVTGDPNDLTLAVGLQRFIDGQYDQQWGPFAAGALLAAIPVMLLFLFLQKYVVSGLTAGATKG